MSNFKELRTQNISHGVIASTFEDQQATIDLTSPALTVINNLPKKRQFALNTTLLSARRLNKY